MKQVQIGWWIEKEARKVTNHTSYAADHIEKVTKPGRYPLHLTFETGYTIPMPYWVLCKIDAETVGGGYYSGFAGNNFRFDPAQLGPSGTHVQMYAYQLPDLLDAGTVEIFPQWMPLVDAERSDKTWKQDEHGDEFCASMSWVRDNITWESLEKVAQ
jgi:hypothetical protein